MSFASTNSPLPIDYVDQQNFISSHHPGATVHNNNFIGIASYNIFVGVYVATIFGSAFFLDLFWPERQESPSVKLAWRICSILACMFTLSAALAFTIIVATSSAYISGAATREQAQQYLAEYNHPPLEYRHNGRGVASVVLEEDETHNHVNHDELGRTALVSFVVDVVEQLHEVGFV